MRSGNEVMMAMRAWGHGITGDQISHAAQLVLHSLISLDSELCAKASCCNIHEYLHNSMSLMNFFVLIEGLPKSLLARATTRNGWPTP